jgi:DNA polymerase III gamma/tau subunit
MLLADLPDHEVTIVRQQASGCSLEDIQRFFTLLLHADEEISKTPYAQLVVEMTLVKLASQPPIMPIDEALARLEALQKTLAGAQQATTIASLSREEFTRTPPSPPPALTPLRPAPVRREEPRERPISAPDAPAVAPPPMRSSDTVLAPMATEDLVAWEGFLRAVQKEKSRYSFP